MSEHPTDGHFLFTSCNCFFSAEMSGIFAFFMYFCIFNILIYGYGDDRLRENHTGAGRACV